MPKFAANLSFLFNDAAFSERFRRAAAAGFKGVEYLFPYEWPAADVASWLQAAGLEQVLFNLAPGDWAAGERGLACLPQREDEFVTSIELAHHIAESAQNEEPYPSSSQVSLLWDRYTWCRNPVVAWGSRQGSSHRRT